MEHDIFISYAKEDKDIADIICQSLEENNIKCWIAARDIIPSESYPKAIISAIKASSLIVLVFSKFSNRSPYVIRELECAIDKKIPILPFKIEDVELSDEIEYLLSSTQWLDAITPPVDSHIPKLIESIKFQKIETLSGQIKSRLEDVKRLKEENKDSSEKMNEIWEYNKERFVLMAKDNENLIKYEGIIFTVGFSKEPMILNILVNKPKSVYFIVSIETLKILDDIVEETGLKPSQYKYSLISSKSPLEAYRAVRKALKFLEDMNKIQRDKIALDPTGGTKIMSVGCGIAANVFKLGLMYISYKRYNPDLRRPEPGTEMLLSMPRPFKILDQEDLDFNIAVNNPEIYWEFGVFFSYSTLDSEFYHMPEIVSKLKSYPEIDKVLIWEKNSGENIVRFMEKNLGRCEVFILFCSENASKSKSVRDEWEAAFQLRKEGKLKIIPVHYNPDHVPNLLKPMLDVKFTGDDLDGFVAELYKEIFRKPENIKPVSR